MVAKSMLTGYIYNVTHKNNQYKLKRKNFHMIHVTERIFSQYYQVL